MLQRATTMTASSRLLLATVAVLAACGSTESERPAGADGGPTPGVDAAPAVLSCEDTALEWYEGLIATPAWRACTTDSDCVFARNDVRCVAEEGDLHFGGCGIAVAASSSDDFESHRAEREAALCARSDRPRCEAGSVCAGLFAICNDGTCSESTFPTGEQARVLAAQCARRPIDECDADGHCYVVEGQRIDLERECAGPMEPAGCVTEWRAGGTGDPVCLNDLDGNTWLFPMGALVAWTGREVSDCLGLDACE